MQKSQDILLDEAIEHFVQAICKSKEANGHFVQAVCKLREAKFDWESIDERFADIVGVIRGQEGKKKKPSLLERTRDMEERFNDG